MNARKDIERVQTKLKNEFLKNFQVKVEEERVNVNRNDPPTQPDIMSNLMANKANTGMAMIAEKAPTPIFQLPSHFDNGTSKNVSTFSSLLGTPAPAQPPSLFNQPRVLNLTPCNNFFNPSPVVGVNLFTSEGNTPMINMFELLNVNNKPAGQQVQQQSMPPSFLTQQPPGAIQSMGASPFNQNANQIVLTNGLIMNPLRRPEPSTVQQQQQIAAILNGASADLGNMNGSNNISSIFGNSTFQTQLSPNNPMDTVSKSFEAVNLSSMSSPLHFQSTPQMNPFHSSLMATPQLNIRLPSLFSSPGAQTSFNIGGAPNLFPLNASNLFSSTIRRFATGEGNGPCDLMPAKSEQLGTYSKEERMKRIMRYKNKIQKWRQIHPVNRAFSGRSKVAGNKPRVKGRFVKNDELEEFGSALKQPAPTNINRIDEIACEDTGNSSGSPNNNRLIPE